MLKREFKSLTSIDIERIFGPQFSQSLFSAPLLSGDSKCWRGPYESAFGLHLVCIDERTAEIIPTFDDVRVDVEVSWLEQAQRTANQKNLKDLIKKYKVDVQDANETVPAK